MEEGSVATSVTIAEVVDSQEQQQQQSKSNGAVSRRVAGQNVALSNGNSTSNVGRVTPRSHMEQEKRMRREIANSNERRRMQSINAGFQSLRTLLPHHEGEKLSKVSGRHCVPSRCSITYDCSGIILVQSSSSSRLKFDLTNLWEIFSHEKQTLKCSIKIEIVWTE